MQPPPLHERLSSRDAADRDAAAGVLMGVGTDTPAPAAQMRGPAPSILRAVLQRAVSVPSFDDAEAEIAIFRNDHEATRLQDVTFQFFDMAAMDLCEFGGKAEWAKDVYAIAHNASRCELEDLVTILVAIVRIGAKLTLGDIARFKHWWSTAAMLFNDALDAERHVLLPWMQGCGADAAIRVPVMQTEVRKLMAQVDTGFTRCIGGSPRGMDGSVTRERLCIDLFVAFDRFITCFITHMYDQEVHLSPALSARGPDGRDKLINALLAETRKSGRADFMFVLYAKWINDPKAHRMVVAKIREYTDVGYTKLCSQFEVNHAATVAVFKAKAGIP